MCFPLCLSELGKWERNMTALYLQLELATARSNSAVSRAAVEDSTPD